LTVPSYRFLPFVTAIFVTCLIVSNIIAVKLASFGALPFLGPLFLPVAVVIFPVSYIFGDVLTEVYGYARARQVIWVGFACNLLAVLAIWGGGRLPAAPFWNAGAYETADAAQRAYEAILGFTPRLLLASFAAQPEARHLRPVALDAHDRIHSRRPAGRLRSVHHGRLCRRRADAGPRPADRHPVAF
jgi:uncharacterized PurR-regulated membrane protein YhhQ (DUF165 family)